jgi:hypothetical protein
MPGGKKSNNKVKELGLVCFVVDCFVFKELFQHYYLVSTTAALSA